MEIKIGMVVISSHGHDKDSFYIVKDVKDGFAYIVDGRRRLVEKPKKKNLRHLKKTNIYVDSGFIYTNKVVRKFLHSYNFNKD